MTWYPCKNPAAATKYYSDVNRRHFKYKCTNSEMEDMNASYI